MKTNQWIRLGLFALATTVALPAVAQRKRPAKGKVAKVVIAQPKAGNYRIDGIAPADANGQWVYLYKPSGQGASDSVQIANGRFTLERAVAEDGLIAHLVIPRSYNLSFIPEEGIIKADLAASGATGTPLNDEHTQKSKYRKGLIEEARAKLKSIRADKNLDDKAKEEAQEKVSDELYAKIKPLAEADLKEHPNDAIGLIALQNLLGMEDVNVAKAEALLQQAGDRLRAEESITKMVARLRRVEATQAGAQFVDFEGVDDANKAVRLSDYVGKGHYVLVDFWASWCGPCRREIGHLKKVRDAYTDKGLVILGTVVWDEMEDHLKAMKELEITWPQIFNKTEATELYGIAGIPQIILFDPAGKIVARDLRGEEINKLLDKALQDNGGKL
ncbi:TlpA disulfide reductase family protein [Porphyromonas somerae]|uniref:Antioxidant, AhpC/TSA family n=1 Tax=Porphyromonas somerae TaxID=322095 RepID=A0A134AYV4_9PORP|nr:TlpA disulfide reductase family protein [Porphyromonas somerae]KXB70702.1 antioxidant, AhpC/TSA family [Porphyromonadaceae bacterium KA00676]KXB72872.1 antioxidant, AhpC/TSA family [Porphyromonas somerae]